MSVRSLVEMLDRAQGPIRRFAIIDGAVIRNLSTVAVEFVIEDEDGNVLATRPGHIVQAKSTGEVDVMMLGSECDFDGLGKELIFSIRCHYAQAMDGVTPATNVLTNAGFDTYTGGSGIADSWTLVGAQTATWDVGYDDPAPPTIFGRRQAVYHAALGQPDYIQQAPALTLAAGDVISVGCFHRCYGGAGEVANNNHAIFYRRSGGSNQYVQFRVGDQNWYFAKGSLTATAPDTAVTFGLDGRGTTLKNRYDECFAFKGRWATLVSDRRRVRVAPVSVTPRAAGSGDHIRGFGGFDVDSNGDGIADGWSRSGSGNTYAHDRDPDNLETLIYPGEWGAQKVTVAGSTTERLRLIWRGKFNAGETWVFPIRYKNSGALGGAPADGDFGVVLHTEEFDGLYESSPLSSGNFGVASVASYATASATLALTAAHSALVLDINLKTATGGDLWLDSARLLRTV